MTVFLCRTLLYSEAKLKNKILRNHVFFPIFLWLLQKSAILNPLYCILRWLNFCAVPKCIIFDIYRYIRLHESRSLGSVFLPQMCPPSVIGMIYCTLTLETYTVYVVYEGILITPLRMLWHSYGVSRSYVSSLLIVFCYFYFDKWT